ncbi:MAG: hypothetical protein ABIQ12_15015, partial [Opitutaceae bacterium]
MKCAHLLFALLLSNVLDAAEPGKAVPAALYDKDPNHVWNRLHSALTPPAPEADAIVAADDLLDPQIWFHKFFQDAETNRRIVALLGEFVKGEPLPASMSALQRAVMQRDLLAVFHWLAGNEVSLKG